ncbi:FIST C domain-containing protein [Flexibacter flexilis DSM 6793]|uniref:FIST C domain-containing protein n=1 Tax=Flexibacter flexilis DSM 6793 TaxID=927664 RepID=A0A1I1L711_9BACT|nr:FIST N-terminal domain-containing protein [Flexibacter flexilis]SFC66778.1 FIST C domain-containing protein [Flexibacter flexilis DSM 6793]
MNKGIYCQTERELVEIAQQLANTHTYNSYLLFIADSTRLSPDTAQLLYKILEKPLLGGIYPELIAASRRQQTGFLLIPLPMVFEVTLLDLSKNMAVIIQQLETLGQLFSVKSVFCFVDFLSQNKDTLIQEVYNTFGHGVNYLGAGAGALDFKPLDSILYNGIFYGNTALVAVCGSDIQVGVAHGWSPISEPIKVTEVDGNIVKSLNWQPAFEVYQKEIFAHSGKQITEATFFEIAKSYPLGLVRMDAEMVIRDPYASLNGHLHIIDHVPQGDYVRIMHGNPHSLLAGAEHAISLLNNGEKENTLKFCVDCISRVLYMDADFVKELNILGQNGLFDGVLSLGEIANAGESALELYNKTVVISQWNVTK